MTREVETGGSSPRRARAHKPSGQTVYADMHCAGETVYPFVGFESIATTCSIRIVRVISLRAHVGARTESGGGSGGAAALFESTGIVAGDACIEATEGAPSGLRSIAFMRSLLAAACVPDGRGAGQGRAATRALLRSLQETLCGTHALARLSGADDEGRASAEDGPTVHSVAGLRALLERAPAREADDARGGADALYDASSTSSAVSAVSAASAHIISCVRLFSAAASSSTLPLLTVTFHTNPSHNFRRALPSTYIALRSYAAAVLLAACERAVALRAACDTDAPAPATATALASPFVWLLNHIVSPLLATISLPSHVPRPQALIAPLRALLSSAALLRASVGPAQERAAAPLRGTPGPAIAGDALRHALQLALSEVSLIGAALCGSVCADLVAARCAPRRQHVSHCAWAQCRADYWEASALLAHGACGMVRWSEVPAFTRAVSERAPCTAAASLDACVAAGVKVPLALRRFACSAALERAVAHVRAAMLHRCGLASVAARAGADCSAPDGAHAARCAASVALRHVWRHALAVKKALVQMVRTERQTAPRAAADELIDRVAAAMLARARFLIRLPCPAAASAATDGAAALDALDAWSEAHEATLRSVRQFVLDGMTTTAMKGGEPTPSGGGVDAEAPTSLAVALERRNIGSGDLERLLEDRLVQTREEVEERIAGFDGFKSILATIPPSSAKMLGGASQMARRIRTKSNGSARARSEDAAHELKCIVLRRLTLTPMLVPTSCSAALRAALQSGFETLFEMVVLGASLDGRQRFSSFIFFPRHPPPFPSFPPSLLPSFPHLSISLRDPNYRYISCESFSPFDLLPLTSPWSRNHLPCVCCRFSRAAPRAGAEQPHPANAPRQVPRNHRRAAGLSAACPPTNLRNVAAHCGDDARGGYGGGGGGN